LFDASVTTKLTVLAWIASLNTAVTLPPGAIPVAFDDGLVLDTVGAVVSELDVVNDHVTALSVFPARSCAPLKVAVYTVPGNRFVVGSSVTVCVVGLYVNPADTVVTPFFSTKLIVLDCTDSLSVAVTLLDIDTAVEFAAGLVLSTVGDVVSALVVVNDHVTVCITFPDRSNAPESVAAYVVPGSKFAFGSSVTVRLTGS
jgi:hypothetical protein